MARIGRDDIESNYNAKVPDNNQKLIKASDVREVLDDYNDSKFNLVDDGLEKIKDTFTFGQGLPGNNALEKLESMIKVFGRDEVRIFYVDIVADGSLGDGQSALDPISSNNNTVSVTNTAIFTSGNRINISFSQNYGFPQYSVELVSSQDYQMESVNQLADQIEFRLVKASGLNTQAPLRFIFKYVRNSDYIADL